MPAVTSVEKAKRVRRRQSRLNINDALSSMVDVHDVAYWSQWRLAIHGVCAQFEAAAQVEVDAWSRERVDHVSISRQQALSSEIRHLEAQLGKHTSMNAKLEAASFENAEALAKTESARVTAAAVVTRLQAQISHEKQAASVSARELEKKISLSTIAYQGLEESLHQAEAAKLEAQDKGAELLREAARTAAEMSEVRLAMATALEESRAEKHNREALQADLAVLREKYSALKRRFVDAGKKVEAVRAERDALRRERAVLEDKLADVEKFQSSKRGQALDRMEQELAAERMARVELEADRDDLQSQLAAALHATGRT
ncbi:unnamed protein product [Pylaiella littoralis]